MSKKKLIIGMLKVVAMLPLGVLYLFSDLIGFLLCHVIKYRKKVIFNNLSESFPEKSAREIQSIAHRYYRYMSDTIVETVKLLHISDASLARRVQISDVGLINDAVNGGRDVVLLLGHYGNWEWVQQLGVEIRDDVHKFSIYHPLKSRLWDDIYKEIRSRWHSRIIPQRSAVRTLIDAANRPWVCGFIADGRPENREHAPVMRFLNHDVRFITGPELIGDKLGAEYFFLEMDVLKRGYYRISFHRLRPVNDGAPYPYMRAFMLQLEKVITRNPAFWLWSHKRFKF